MIETNKKEHGFSWNKYATLSISKRNLEFIEFWKFAVNFV
jgi:hypothetical protein